MINFITKKYLNDDVMLIFTIQTENISVALRSQRTIHYIQNQIQIVTPEPSSTKPKSRILILPHLHATPKKKPV